MKKRIYKTQDPANADISNYTDIIYNKTGVRSDTL
jgi:hypothetical protein